MTDILKLIDSEIAALTQARALIASTALAEGQKKQGRPAKAASTATVKPKKRKKMSAESRAKIAAAQKKRWAAVRKLENK